MPGLLVMDQHAAQRPDGLKKDPDQATAQTNGIRHSPSLDGIRQSDFAQHKMVDANNAPPVNGSVQTGLSKGKNGQEQEKDQDHNQGQDHHQDTLPPELEHWDHTYLPLGKLLERMAQQCYSDLIETVDSMADMPVKQPPPAINGAVSHSGSNSTLDSSSESVEKKLRLMNFAQEHKDRFLKALVLTNWARNMEHMNKLIELRMWQQQQDDAYNTVADAFIRLKHNMIPAKMPNPNIQGALELLSTGRAPWMPDLGYIPPKPLDARQLLGTLKAMNFALAVRLNVHEELPQNFQTYSIANGRATFLVPNEFEVDLAVADEEPDSPFYFIDLRLLFSNSPLIPDGAVRANIEAKVNEVLATDGLNGCYLYLHDFVLTHKTNLLRRQAFDMARGKWHDCIRIETIHRDFVVHYWTGQPGSKNWIHVGTVSSSKPGAGSASRPSQLGIRWVRERQDTSDVIDVSHTQHSMEEVLERIIANHIRSRLRRIASRLWALSGPGSALKFRLKTQQEDSNVTSLEMQFGRSRAPLNLRISPVTGDFSIYPATPITLDVERKLNLDPSLDAGQLLSALHCKLLQDQIRKHTQRLGWLTVQIGRKEDITKTFGADVVRWSVFIPKTWGDEWAIASTISLGGEKWWVVRLNANAQGTMRSIQSAEALPLATTPISIDRASLMDIESKSIAQISFSNITRELRQRSVQYELRQVGPTTSEATESIPHTTALYFNFRDLMQPKSSQISKTWKAWCHEVLVLTHHGICEESADGKTGVLHVLKASLTQHAASSLAKVGDLNSKDDADISFSQSGACALRLRTNFGEGLVTLIEARLKRVERLNNYVRIAHQAKARLTRTSVTSLVLQYHSEPSLSAELRFSDKADAAVQLLLTASMDGRDDANANPHRRMQPLLKKLLEPSDTPGQEQGSLQEYRRFQNLLAVLDFTLPLLRGITKLEEAGPSTIAVRGSAYSYNHHKLIYRTPFPDAVFDFQIHHKDGRNVWIVKPPLAKSIKSPELVKALRRLWASSGNGWFGLRTGAFAEKKGVEDLLDRLDAAVREALPATTDQTADSGTSGDKTEKNGEKPVVVVLD